MKTIERNTMSRRDFLKAVGLAAGATGLTLVLPGCAQPGAGPSTNKGVEGLTAGMVDTSIYKKPSPWTIARSGMGEVNSWQVSATLHFRYGVEEKYKGLFKNVYTAAAKFDAAQQVSDLEDLLSKNPDVLIVTPVSGGNCIAQIEKAMAKNIPVILPGARAYTDKYLQYVDRDNTGAGRVSADYICKQIGGKGNVVIMEGLAGNTYAEDDLRGVREALALYPDIKEVALVYGAWSPTEGKTAMAGVLAQGVKIDGIINAGGNMGIGIFDAYKDAGLPVPPLCGDTGNGWLRVAKENNLKFVGTYPGGNELFLDAVDTAVQTLRGQPVAKNVIPENVVITEADLDKLYRPDLNDQYWAMSKLPESWNVENYKK